MITVKYIGTQPIQQTSGASGYDLIASKGMSIAPGSTSLVPTNLQVEIPPGYEAQVRPRSGMALKHSVTVLNTPGTIDSDYRGHIGAIIINHGDKMFEVNKGDRIAQLVFSKVEIVKWEAAEELEGTHRGTGGFGSTDDDLEWNRCHDHLMEVIAHNQDKASSSALTYLKHFVYPLKRKFESGVRTEALYHKILKLTIDEH